jgi:hypothetical protein
MENSAPKIEDVLHILNYGFEVKIPGNCGVVKKNNNLNSYQYSLGGVSKNISEKELTDILEELRFWVTEDNRVYEIRQMSDSHLINTVNMLEKSEVTYNIYSELITKMKILIRERSIDDIFLEDIGIDIV